MPERINDPTAVAFCNRSIRPIADQFASLYIACSRELLNWHNACMAGGQTIAQGIPDTDAVIEDGSDTDGRRHITGSDAHAMAVAMALFVSSCDADDKALLNQVARVAVNSR